MGATEVLTWCLLGCGLFVISGDAANCTLPDDLRGVWEDSTKGSLTFSNDSITGYSIYLFGSFTLTCYQQNGDIYIMESNSFTFFGLTFSGYFCWSINKVTDNLYYVYEYNNALTSADNEKVRMYIPTTARNYSEICDNTSPGLGTYRVLYVNQTLTSAISTCPTVLQAYFSYSITVGGSNVCTGDLSMDGCTSTSYIRSSNQSSNCTTPLGYSAGGQLGCLISKTSGSTTYVTVANTDSAVDDSTTYYYTCMIIDSSKSPYQATQYPKQCPDDMNSTYVASPGGTVSLTLTGSCSTASTSLLWIIAVVLILLLIAGGMLCACYIYRRRKKQQDEEERKKLKEEEEEERRRLEEERRRSEEEERARGQEKGKGDGDNDNSLARGDFPPDVTIDIDRTDQRRVFRKDLGDLEDKPEFRSSGAVTPRAVKPIYDNPQKRFSKRRRVWMIGKDGKAVKVWKEGDEGKYPNDSGMEDEDENGDKTDGKGGNKFGGKYNGLSGKDKKGKDFFKQYGRQEVKETNQLTNKGELKNTNAKLHHKVKQMAVVRSFSKPLKDHRRSRSQSKVGKASKGSTQVTSPTDPTVDSFYDDDVDDDDDDYRDEGGKDRDREDMVVQEEEEEKEEEEEEDEEQGRYHHGWREGDELKPFGDKPGDSPDSGKGRNSAMSSSSSSAGDNLCGGITDRPHQKQGEEKQHEGQGNSQDTEHQEDGSHQSGSDKKDKAGQSGQDSTEDGTERADTTGRKTEAGGGKDSAAGSEESGKTDDPGKSSGGDERDGKVGTEEQSGKGKRKGFFGRFFGKSDKEKDKSGEAAGKQGKDGTGDEEDKEEKGKGVKNGKSSGKEKAEKQGHSGKKEDGVDDNQGLSGREKVGAENKQGHSEKEQSETGGQQGLSAKGKGVTDSKDQTQGHLAKGEDMSRGKGDDDSRKGKKTGKDGEGDKGTGKGGADGKGGTGADGKGGTGADAKGGTGADGKSGTGADGKSGTGADGKSGTGADRKSGTGADGKSGTGADGKSGTGADGKGGTGADGKSGTGADGKGGTGADGKSGTGADGKGGTGADGKSGTGADGKSGKGADGRSGAGADGKSGTGADGKSGTGADGKSGTGADGKGGAGVVGKDGTGTHGKSGTGAHGKDGTGAHGKDGTGAHGKSGTGAHGKDGTGAHGKDGTGAHGKDGTGAHGKDGTGAHGKDGTGAHGKDGTGTHGKDGTGTHGKSGTCAERSVAGTSRGGRNDRDGRAPDRARGGGGDGAGGGGKDFKRGGAAYSDTRKKRTDGTTTDDELDVLDSTDPHHATTDSRTAPNRSGSRLGGKGKAGRGTAWIGGGGGGGGTQKSSSGSSSGGTSTSRPSGTGTTSGTTPTTTTSGTYTDGTTGQSSRTSLGTTVSFLPSSDTPSSTKEGTRGASRRSGKLSSLASTQDDVTLPSMSSGFFSNDDSTTYWRDSSSASRPNTGGFTAGDKGGRKSGQASGSDDKELSDHSHLTTLQVTPRNSDGRPQRQGEKPERGGQRASTRNLQNSNISTQDKVDSKLTSIDIGDLFSQVPGVALESSRSPTNHRRRDEGGGEGNSARSARSRSPGPLGEQSHRGRVDRTQSDRATESRSVRWQGEDGEVSIPGTATDGRRSVHWKQEGSQSVDSRAFPQSSRDSSRRDGTPSSSYTPSRQSWVYSSMSHLVRIHRKKKAVAPAVDSENPEDDRRRRIRRPSDMDDLNWRLLLEELYPDKKYLDYAKATSRDNEEDGEEEYLNDKARQGLKYLYWRARYWGAQEPLVRPGTTLTVHSVNSTSSSSNNASKGTPGTPGTSSTSGTPGPKQDEKL